MNSPLQEQWAKKSRLLTQALILSGALNIGLLTSFFYFVIRDKKEAVTFELQPVSEDQMQASRQLSNAEILAQYATMSYGELVDLLVNQEALEEGYKKRDLALASLVNFHFLNLEKALQGFSLQKRTLSFQHKAGPEQVHITVYPGLSEDQFQGVLHFIKTEKFPYTTQGLFFELQQAKMPRDSSLLEAFYLTPEFTTIMTLFQRAGVPLPQEYVADLLAQGDWKALEQFTEEQKLAQDLSPQRLKALLADYVRCRSLLAAKILLEWDRGYILKKLDDSELMALIDLFPEKNPALETLLKEIIVSPRSDAVWQKAAHKLFAFAQLPCPEPYDHHVTLQTFAKDRVANGATKPQTSSASIVRGSVAPVATPVTGRQIHTVQAGENLWKIARKYKVSVEVLKKTNHLETEKLRPGKELIIPNK